MILFLIFICRLFFLLMIFHLKFTASVFLSAWLGIHTPFSLFNYWTRSIILWHFIFRFNITCKIFLCCLWDYDKICVGICIYKFDLNYGFIILLFIRFKLLVSLFLVFIFIFHRRMPHFEIFYSIHLIKFKKIIL